MIPHRMMLAVQLAVTGYLGRELENSYHGGDYSTEARLRRR
jgi:hypothetical protein